MNEAFDTATTANLLIDSSLVRPWLIVESGDRWTRAVRRFATHLIPDHLVAVINTAQLAAAHSSIAQFQSLRRGQSVGCVVLWEITAENLAGSAAAIADTRRLAPHALQLAACDHLCPAELIGLTHVGVTTTIGQPEQLPGLKRLIHVHFRRSG